MRVSSRIGGCGVVKRLSLFAVAFASLLYVSTGPAFGETTPTIESLQVQIDALQKQLDMLKAAQAKPTSAETIPAGQTRQNRASTVQANPPSTVPIPDTARGLLSTTAVKVTLGGFTEAMGVYRNRFTGSDVNSKWNIGPGGVPLRNSPNYHMNELRGSARQTRLSILAEGREDYAALGAYFEIDFLGGAATSSANSQESNGYSPRIRHLYATYDTPGGWHLLAGQEWSLLTMNKAGIVARQENIPLTIDSQYVPGFVWTRNLQVRLVKDFGRKVWAGLSLEAPQAIITGGGLLAGNSSGFATTSNYTFRLDNPSNFADVTSTTNNSNLPGSLSLDEYPDIAGKVAFDPGFGHYEVYGVGRFFTDRTLVNGVRSNNTTFGWGVGGAVLLPLVPKLLDFQASLLMGKGIGRYGSAQMFDVVVNPITGKLDPLTEVMALLGLVVHPSDRLDVFGYAGMEQAARKSVLGTTGGFGNPAYAPAGLVTEGSTANSSLAQMASVRQAIVGAWYSFYKGSYGLMRVGLTGAYTRFRVFGLPDESLDTVMMSLRYYPF
jgi:hypothetical protein